ncbi:MAG: folylpolyglutamate synthase/dihydrofolate synthase family protein [Solitalea sp.]
MDYRDTIDYLYSKLPVFHRIGATAYRPDLGNIVKLCDALGQPHREFRSLHIGGTNGKGSVSHMLAAILHQAGYKTGLYTSPHLVDFRERIRVNGQMIPESEVIDFVSSQRPLIESLKPSFFEVTVAMAFDFFARQKVDIAVVEVGMGGRLDSTNIVHPDLSVITNIGFDHVQILGNTLEAIAGEKAGIIKSGIPVVIGEFQEATAAVFNQKAKESGSPIYFASRDWEVHTTPTGLSPFLNLTATSKRWHKELSLALDLTGRYQLKNIKTVLTAIAVLRQADYRIEDRHLHDALNNVKQLTGFAGRWQILSTQPLVVCDTAHNESGIREILIQLAATPHDRLHVVFGMVNDKEVDKVLDMLPKDARYYFCKADVPRAMDAQALHRIASESGLQGTFFPSVKAAISAAREQAGADDLIFIGGSTFVVAEAI